MISVLCVTSLRANCSRVGGAREWQQLPGGWSDGRRWRPISQSVDPKRSNPVPALRGHHASQPTRSLSLLFTGRCNATDRLAHTLICPLVHQRSFSDTPPPPPPQPLSALQLPSSHSTVASVMSSSTCHIEELSSEASVSNNTARGCNDLDSCRANRDVQSNSALNRRGGVSTCLSSVRVRVTVFDCSYEAELNAEVERLKMGDRSSSHATDEAAANAASNSHASAAATSTTAAHSSTADNAEARVADAADNSHSDSAADSAAADGEFDADSAVDASAPILIEEVVEKDAAKAVAAKGRGNQFYARQQYAEAIDEYTLAINLCPSGEAAEAADRENLAVFYSNRAAAYLMQQRHEETISDCTQSLTLHPSNPKALSRRAKAHEALDQLAEAVDDLKALVALDERDRDSARALARVEKALAEKNEKMKVSEQKEDSTHTQLEWRFAAQRTGVRWCGRHAFVFADRIHLLHPFGVDSSTR